MEVSLPSVMVYFPEPAADTIGSMVRSPGLRKCSQKPKMKSQMGKLPPLQWQC